MSAEKLDQIETQLEILRTNKVDSASPTKQQIISLRTQYQNGQLANKYKTLIESVKIIDEDLALAVAKGYYKLLAYKDQYEVARLHTRYLKEAISEEFEKYPKINF